MMYKITYECPDERPQSVDLRMNLPDAKASAEDYWIANECGKKRDEGARIIIREFDRKLPQRPVMTVPVATYDGVRWT